MSSRPHSFLSASDIASMAERRHVHQFNDNAVRLTRTLSDLTGLQRLGVHLVRLQTGRDSTQFHFHDAEEEFLYVLSGRGVAEIGAERIDVGPGDFMGFPCGSPAHVLHNPHAEDLLYLMAGESSTLDVVHYPRLKRSMFKYPGRKRWMSWDDIHEVPK